MGPFDVNPNWFERHWYSPDPPKPMWRLPAALATIAAVMLAALYPQTPPAQYSHRLSPPFLQPQTAQFGSAMVK